MEINCYLCREKKKIIKIYGEASLIGQCIICFKDNLPLVLMTCGHAIICDNCKPTIIEYTLKSPYPVTRALESIEQMEHVEILYPPNHRLGLRLPPLLFNHIYLNDFVPNLGGIARRANLTVDTMDKLHDWIVENNIVNCSEVYKHISTIRTVVFGGKICEFNRLSNELLQLMDIPRSDYN